MKIYTRVGDGGESSLYNGEKRKKHHMVFEALGDVDEINSVLGLAREHCLDAKNGIDQKLAEVQSRLLDVGSAVATPATSSAAHKLERTKFDASNVQTLETWIDELTEELPALTQFILPSGGLAASTLHMARVVCRRAERKVWPLVDGDQVEDAVGKYLNRLSDFLFTAARYAALKEHRSETVYKKA
eukprot:scaffold283_cov316-Pavlova_lutheri.AAC.33